MKRPYFAGIGGHHSSRSKTEEWLTPPAIIDALGGPESFALDPCAPAVQPWPTARRTLTIHANGLLHPWEGRVWLNPPYSTAALTAWLGRLAAHGIGTALIFARTDTAAFGDFVWARASALLFIRGRLTFHRPDGSIPLKKTGTPMNSGAPSVLCAYGRDDADVLALSGIQGQFVALRLDTSILVVTLEPTWREVIDALMARAGEDTVRLDDLYRAALAHPKARRSQNVPAKVRQQLQLGGHQRRGRGVWARKDAG